MNILREIYYFFLFVFIKIKNSNPVKTITSYLSSYDIKETKHIIKLLYKRGKRKTTRFSDRFLIRLKSIFFKSLFFLVKLEHIIFLSISQLRKSSIKAANMMFRKKVVKNRKKKKQTYEKKFFYEFKFFTLGLVFSLLFIFLPLLAILFISQLPNPYDLSVNSIPKTTKIYDRNMDLLYEIYANQNRTIVKLSDIPKHLINATIATEDKDFYKHPGFDVKGMARAALNNLKTGELQGGSTITQQLIKSALLNPQPTISRKLKEIVLAFLAERVYSKEKILELYFNYVPYGGTAWGVQSASEIYFGKDVHDLDLAQSAFLAGVTKAPSVYSPFSNNGSTWKKRQKEVLDAMVREGYIISSQSDEAYNKTLVFNSPQVPIKAPHFVMYVRDQLVQKYGLNEVERGGLKVVTTLDLGIQDFAEKTVVDEVENDAYLNIKNGATLVSDPKNGDILAMVGNHNYFDTDNGGNVNIATSLRQPGSSIKIVTYALALSSGFTEASILDDSPLIVPSSNGNYTPVNYDGKFHGRLSLRLALANSLNIPAVRLAQKIGVANIVDFGESMGIKSWKNPDKYGLSITLGAAEVTMFDMARVYNTVANAGKAVDIDPFIEISDSEGNVIYKKSSQPVQVLDSGVAFIISDILSDNKARSMEFGLFSPLKIEGHRVSVKTGTSDNKRDNWTDGFTKDYTVITWVGNNDNTPMSQNLASGITGAAPIWNKIMTYLLKDKTEEPFIVPENVVKKTCFGYDAYFIRGTEKSSCNYITPVPTATLLNFNISVPNNSSLNTQNNNINSNSSSSLSQQTNTSESVRSSSNVKTEETNIVLPTVVINQENDSLSNISNKHPNKRKK